MNQSKTDRPDLLWLSHLGFPCLVKVQKGDHRVFLFFLATECQMASTTLFPTILKWTGGFWKTIVLLKGHLGHVQDCWRNGAPKSLQLSETNGEWFEGSGTNLRVCTTLGLILAHGNYVEPLGSI